MKRTCRHCSAEFEITDRDQAFFDRMGVPEGPTLCPTDMGRYRLSFRNEIDLYKRKIDKPGDEVITYHPPHVLYPVYSKDVWWSDAWDPMDYGRDLDLKRSFFEQLTELSNVVPRASIYLVESENSDYTNYAVRNKNSYLIFGSWYDEDCLYGQSIYHSKSCMDCHFVSKCELCYECIDCNECYGTKFSQNCQNCTNSWLLFDCRQCEDCIGCWNLRSKKHHIWDKPATKEEVEALRLSLSNSLSTLNDVRQKLQKYLETAAIHRPYVGENNENVSGNFIYNSKNVVNSYNIQKCEDIYHSDRTMEEKDQYFCTGVHFGELAYNCVNIDYSNTVLCCMNGEHQTNTAYCFECHSVQDCFGCIGLRHKNHCILNKQYTKEVYEKLVPEIIERMKKAKEWGEFFPLSMNPFYFNRSVSFDYYPLEKEQAVKRGYRWKEEGDEMPDVKKVIPAAQLPEHINDIPDDVLHWAILCEATKRPYKITKQELNFYREQHLPLPHFHPEERSRRRVALRNPRTLWKRTCAKCSKPIETTYSPERLEIVYCEECYLKEVY